MSKRIYLSHILDESTPGYGGRKGFHSDQILSINQGDACNQSEWKLSNHIGTHVDAPFHFDNEGKKINQFSPDDWIFDHVQLFEIEALDSQLIEVGDWCKKINSLTQLLLIKTGFEKYRDQEKYWAHNPGLSLELVHWLKSNHPKVRAIGMDFISVTSYDHRATGKEVHRALLKNDISAAILLIEDMKLDELKRDPKRVDIFPLRVKNADGSPVTVIAEIEV